MNKPQHTRNEMLGDFVKGAVKGMLMTGLFLGAMWMVFSGIGIVAGPEIAASIMPHFFSFEAGSMATSLLGLGGILATAGIVNGGLRAYQGANIKQHEARGNMREAQISQSSPTLIPLLGLEHGMSADHALEVEHEHARPQRQWAQSVGTRGDHIQQILSSGPSMSDKDRASAILREREARAAQPQTPAI